MESIKEKLSVALISKAYLQLNKYHSPQLGNQLRQPLFEQMGRRFESLLNLQLHSKLNNLTK